MEGGESDASDGLSDISKVSKSRSIIEFIKKKTKRKKKDSRVLISRESKVKYLEPGSLWEILLSLGWGHIYDGIKQTQCKPWDNRELDVLDGIKTIYFWMTIICMCVFMLFQTNIPDIL
tara:strand:+ start:1039 stop:1395 length:357 start_codon:yes stop_codon:yes gene_type:complete